MGEKSELQTRFSRSPNGWTATACDSLRHQIQRNPHTSNQTEFSIVATVQQPVRSRPIRVNEVPWQEGAPGMRTRQLWSDEASGRTAHLVQFDPGAHMPLHRHVGHELIYLIEGSLTDEHGTIRPGNIAYRPDGCVHSNSSPNGATALAIIAGGNEPATEIGDAPPSIVFTLEDQPWNKRPGGGLTKRIVQNEAANWSAAVTRFPSGASLPLHRHVGDELIYVIEGTNTDESGPITPGNMSYRPNGCEHSVSTALGATVLAVVWGRTEPI